MDPQVLLKVMRHHTVLVWRGLVALLTHVHFARGLQVDTLERLGRKCQLRDVAGDQQCWQCRTSWGVRYGLRGPEGRGTTCPFGAINVMVVGEWWALFGACFKGKGAHLLSILREGAPEERGADSSALWTPAAMRSTSKLAGVPKKANSTTPESLLLQACYISLELHCLPQLPQHLQINKKRY